MAVLEEAAARRSGTSEGPPFPDQRVLAGLGEHIC